MIKYFDTIIYIIIFLHSTVIKILVIVNGNKINFVW